MANEKVKLSIPETKGQFQAKGIVTGTLKDNFYRDKPTKTNKPFRAVNFGVQINKDKTIYLSLNGMEKDEVFFSKRGEDKKTIVERVKWKDRFVFNKEGFRLIGVNVGVAKVKDQKGNDVNDKKVLAEYDACKEISDNLKDDVSVFTKGKIEFSHFKNDKGEIRRSIKFVPNQISLCKDVEFESEDFKEDAAFTQIIIFTGIDQEKVDNKPTGRFIVNAKIVTYNSVEEAEFVVVDKALANQFKQRLKPYNAIKVWGNIEVSVETEEVSEADCWGESNTMDKANSSARRELIITGADPSTLDTTTYTEQNISEAIAVVNSNNKAESDYGSDSWGSVNSTTSDDDDEAWD